MRETVLIKGAGEQASGVAHRLYRCGFAVLMTELPRPSAVRLGVSFCTAIYDGEVVVEGIRGRAFGLGQFERLGPPPWDFVPVFVDPRGELIERWRPDVVVDGRILKYNPDDRVDQAGLTIGLGPGLLAGCDVHLVVETNRGHDLGRLILEGQAAPNTSVPGELGGASAKRVLRAPRGGVFRRQVPLGSLVRAGTLVASVEGSDLLAELDGVVRGLCRDGIVVAPGRKVGDIDPRGQVGSCTTLSDKARTISGAVLEAILTYSSHR